jgi:hypothetical protein
LLLLNSQSERAGSPLSVADFLIPLIIPLTFFWYEILNIPQAGIVKSSSGSEVVSLNFIGELYIRRPRRHKKIRNRHNAPLIVLFPIDDNLSCPKLMQIKTKEVSRASFLIRIFSSRWRNETGVMLHQPSPWSARLNFSTEELSAVANSDNILPNLSWRRHTPLLRSEHSEIASSKSKAQSSLSFMPFGTNTLSGSIYGYLFVDSRLTTVSPENESKGRLGFTIVDSIQHVLDESETSNCSDNSTSTVLSAYIKQIPVFHRSPLVLQLSKSRNRQLGTLPASKPEFQPPKIITALIPSQDGSKGVVEYALYGSTTLSIPTYNWR